jgi:hypothetical protein
MTHEIETATVIGEEDTGHEDHPDGGNSNYVNTSIDDQQTNHPSSTVPRHEMPHTGVHMKKHRKTTSKHPRRKKNISGDTDSQARAKAKQKSKAKKKQKTKSKNNNKKSDTINEEHDRSSTTPGHHEETAEDMLDDIFTSSNRSYHSEAPPFVRAVVVPDDFSGVDLEEQNHHAQEVCEYPEVLQVEDLGIVHEENVQSLSHHRSHTHHGTTSHEEGLRYQVRIRGKSMVVFFLVIIFFGLVIYTSDSSSSATTNSRPDTSTGYSRTGMIRPRSNSSLCLDWSDNSDIVWLVSCSEFRTKGVDWDYLSNPVAGFGWLQSSDCSYSSICDDCLHFSRSVGFEKNCCPGLSGNQSELPE